jgi:hypothetical protein
METQGGSEQQFHNPTWMEKGLTAAGVWPVATALTTASDGCGTAEPPRAHYYHSPLWFLPI